MVSKKPRPKLNPVERSVARPCQDCDGTYWICEEHPDRPMEHDGCGAAGLLCPWCNAGLTLPQTTCELVVELIPDEGWRSAEEVSSEIGERRRVRTRTSLNLMPGEWHGERKARPRSR
jgi:hypothetical protein